MLSGIIKEVAHGIGTQTVIAENIVATPSVDNSQQLKRKEEEYEKQRQERIKRLNESMPFGNTNVFEGTDVIPAESTPGSALAGVSPTDTGVNIDGILNLSRGKWKSLI